jgi:hypothetical protein
MAKINKTQTYAVLWLSQQGTDVSGIANELSLTEKQVQNIIDKSKPVDNSTNSIPTTSGPVGKIKSKDLMITESASKTRSVAIMTQQASALNDELKKKSSSKPDSQQGIFRPFDKSK